jgi:glycosyltransferase involved in cell wall biosynthesis
MDEKAGTEVRKFRFAAYGFVDRRGGSVASANSELLEELLRNGHRVDFYTIERFLNPTELSRYAGYRFLPVGVRPILAGWKLVDRLPLGFWTYAYSQLSGWLHDSTIARRIAREHATQPYDFLLSLGLLAPFRVKGLPCLSWPQSAPQSEWEALRRLRPTLRQFIGRGLYAALALVYWRKQRQSRSRLAFSDRIVCGSRWTASQWQEFGFPAAAIQPIAYPIDLDQFQLVARAEEHVPVFRFLWLGRIVPRKRLDLLLAAFKLLRAQCPDVELLIVGRFTYAKGLARLLDEYAGVGGIDYRPAVAHDEIPRLLRQVDAIVQPSENEDIGSTVLEGLACGLPAIVGPTNGTRDYFGASSVVFEEYTPESLAAGMSRLMDTVRSGRAAVAADCRAAAERFLSVERVVAALEEVLATIAEGSGTVLAENATGRWKRD